MNAIHAGISEADESLRPHLDGESWAHNQPLTKSQLAKYFQVTPRTIELWMKSGLPYFKISRSVRFRLTDVMGYLNAKCRRSQPGSRLSRIGAASVIKNLC
jgi:hypothetical protein